MKINTQIIDTIIKLYKDGKSIRQIEDSVPIKRTRIETILHENHITMRTRGNSYKLRKYDVNHTFFEDIKTEHQAYWLGFLAADGHINYRDKAIIVHIMRNDKDHLEKMKTSMNSTHIISDGESYAKGKAYKHSRLSIYSIQLYNDIIKYRIKEQFPNINTKLYPHFIRGIIDGDGSITITYRQKKGYTNISTEHKISLCGNPIVIQSIKDILINTLSISNTKTEKQNKIDIICWTGRKQVKTIIDWLYKDATIFLDRKHKIAKEII